MIPSGSYTKTEKQMAKTGYIVVCDTCGEIFFESNFLAIMRLVVSGEWTPTKEMDWYREAAQHWWKHRKEKGEIHMINVYVVTDGVRNLHFGITSHWLNQIWRDSLTDQQIEESLKELLDSTNSKVVRS